MPARTRITGSAVALYNTAGTGGNAPFTDPLGNLSSVKFHSALNYLQVARDVTKTINHAAVAGAQTWSWTTFSTNYKPQAYEADYLLDTHNLGYVPLCIVAQGTGVVEPGMPVQVNAGGGARFLDIYLTTTEVRVKERVDSGTSTLAAISRDYRILLLKSPAAVPGTPEFIATATRIRAGNGYFDTNSRFLRRKATGESPYTLGAAKMIDTENGICKFVDALGNASYDFYSAADYDGTLAAPTAFEVSR